MKIKIWIYLFSVVLLTNVSCTFHQDITFNEDYSGSMNYTIDMSALKALAGDEEGEEEESESIMDDEDLMDSMRELEKIDGISNVKMEEDEEKGIYVFGYDFANLDRLNESMAGSDMLAEGNNEGHVYLKQKGKKKLIFKMPEMKGEGGEIDTESMEGMEEMFKYELTMNFPKPVKKLKTKSGAVLTNGDKTVKLSTTLTALTNGTVDPSMQIKF